MCAKFYQYSTKTERLVCVSTEEHTDRASSLPLLLLIRNIYGILYRLGDVF